MTPLDPGVVHVSGDGAARLRAAIAEGGQAVLADAPDDAGLQVIGLRRWQNLEGSADLARLCGRACDGAADVVRLRRPSPAGLTEVLLIDLGALGAGDALDRTGDPGAAAAACVAALAGRGGGACPDLARRTAWRPAITRR